MNYAALIAALGGIAIGVLITFGVVVHHVRLVHAFLKYHYGLMEELGDIGKSQLETKKRASLERMSGYEHGLLLRFYRVMEPKLTAEVEDKFYGN